VPFVLHVLSISAHRFDSPCLAAVVLTLHYRCCVEQSDNVACILGIRVQLLCR
jgi:hypothetical protein